MDNFGSVRPADVEHILDSKDFETIQAEIRESRDFPQVDEIYHLASRASPKDFQEHPVQVALTNTTGTRNLLDHAVEHNEKMLFASTSEVYGNPEVHPRTNPTTET